MPDDLEVALLTVTAAADIALRAFRDLPSVAQRLKDDGSVVTAADRAAEEAARGVLTHWRPADAVVGEELQATAGADGPVCRRWIIDPIDGTAYFISGDDRWLVLLALEVEGILEVAVVQVPARGQVWWAVRGGGAFAGRVDSEGVVTDVRELRIAGTETALTQVRIGVVPPAPFQMDSDRDLAARAGVGVEAAQWSMHPALLVAEGELDVAVQTRASIWDVAATTLIVAEAGGCSSNLNGSPDLVYGPRVFSTGPWVHAAMLATMAVGQS